MINTKTKVNCIELQETRKPNEMHPTKEESRKIIPKELKKLQIISKSLPMKYQWEVEGEKIIQPDKLHFTRTEKKILKSLFLQKMPDKYRKSYWLIASGGRREMLNNPNYYKNLTVNFPDNLPSPYESQIDMDITRTFPDDPFFQNEENLRKLKNVLVAYSRRNLSIGYCQGFNFIIGKLLMIYESEEEAFWIFVQLIENVLPMNYYTELAGIMVDCTILLKLVKRYFPALMEHLAELGYELSLNNLVYKWFVSLYIQNLSHDLFLIVWDLLFFEGEIVLFKSAIALLKILKDDFLSADTMEGIQHIIEENTFHLNDEYTLLYYLLIRRFEFDMEFISTNRDVFLPNVIANIQKASQHKQDKNPQDRKNSLIADSIDCKKDWQLCLYDRNYKYLLFTYLIYQIQEPYPSNVIEDYFFEKSSNAINIDDRRGMINLEKDEEYILERDTEEEFKKNQYKYLLIERRQHFCQSKGKNKVAMKKCKSPPSSFFNLDRIHDDMMNCTIIETVEKTDLPREKKILFETFNPRPLMDIEEFIIEDPISDKGHINI